MSHALEHSPTPFHNENHRYSSSSPDPLQSSPTSIHVRHSSPTRPSVSPSKRNTPRSLRLHDLTISTPPRAKYRQENESKPRPQTYVASQQLPEGASPWRIRVTVEAEPESEAETGRSKMRTQTLKVPLKGAGDSDEENEEDHAETVDAADRKPRGRKAAQPSPTKPRKRSGTPGRPRKPSRANRKSLTDLDATVLGDDSDDPDAKPKRKRSRARKSSQPKKLNELDCEKETDVEGDAATENAKGSTRSKSRRNRSFQIAEDIDSMQTSGNVESFTGQDSPNLRKIDLNRVSLRAKTAESGQEKRTECHGPQNDLDAHDTENGMQEQDKCLNIAPAEERDYPTPVSSPQTKSRDDVENQSHDPTDVHEEFDSILESEGFTMISIDSIPSARQFVSSPAEMMEQQPAPESRSKGGLQPRLNTDANGSPFPVSSRGLSANVAPGITDDSDISSTMPSSPPSSLHLSVAAATGIPVLRGHTPEISFSSPKLPSPPRVTAHIPTINVEEKPTPPRLARVIRAGIALQSALSPKKSREAGTSPLLRSSHHGQDGFLGAAPEATSTNFDFGTQRELRAGFKLGEELARQRARSSSPAPPQTPKRTSDMPSGPDTVRAQREQEWQRERQAVSQQIDMASTSQVIVIDSDDETEHATIEHSGYGHEHVQAQEDDEHIQEEEDDEDIWLQEAHDSSQHSNNAQQSMPISEPKRSKIPSPWKRGENVDESTYLSQTDISGMFWQASKRPVSKVRIPVSSSPEKSFDLGKLLGVKQSPQKVSFSPKKVDLNSSSLESSSAQEIEDRPQSDAGENQQSTSIYDPDETAENLGHSNIGHAADLVQIEGVESTAASISFDEPSEISSSELEASDIPMIKIPVNFGDESSISRTEIIDENTTYSAGTEESSVDSTRHITSATTDLSIGHESSTLPQAFATTPAGWLGRLGGIAASWSKSHEVTESNNATPQVPSLEERDEYKPVSTLAISSRGPDQSSTTQATHRPRTSTTTKPSPTPLPRSGDWTKDHYRALHRLYLKSLKRKIPKYAQPDLRPGLVALLHQTAMSGTGSHEHKVTMTVRELAVVEEFMRDLERYDDNAESNQSVMVPVGWSEEELAMRLYSIVVGYKVRGERPGI